MGRKCQSWTVQLGRSDIAWKHIAMFYFNFWRIDDFELPIDYFHLSVVAKVTIFACLASWMQPRAVWHRGCEPCQPVEHFWLIMKNKYNVQVGDVLWQGQGYHITSQMLNKLWVRLFVRRWYLAKVVQLIGGPCSRLFLSGVTNSSWWLFKWMNCLLRRSFGVCEETV